MRAIGTWWARLAFVCLGVSIPMIYAGYRIEMNWRELWPASDHSEQIKIELDALRTEEKSAPHPTYTYDDAIDELYVRPGTGDEPTTQRANERAQNRQRAQRLENLMALQAETAIADRSQGVRLGIVMQVLGLLMLTSSAVYIALARTKAAK